ncbi:Feline leukemia virus subgroup C receptor-related protein 2-like [Aphelenchoides fujianensis]|nr:Feline leukemia virus subgroup C receptor-related protein 2-like [Aphelenchoides fujianensis]
MGKLIYAIGIFYSNLIMCGFLFVGMFLTAVIRSDLRRQRAQGEKRELSSVNAVDSPLLTENGRKKAVAHRSA